MTQDQQAISGPRWRRPRVTWTVAVMARAACLLLGCAHAAPAATLSAEFPDQIPLPNGFAPEGIALGRGTSFFAASIAGGSLYKGDLRTGAGRVLVLPTAFKGNALGLKVDRRTNYVFVAGGLTGTARVYDGDSGDQLATYTLATARANYQPLINDVILTRDAAYFTDSCSANLLKLPLGRDGSLPKGPAAVQAIPLRGDFHLIQVPTPGFPCSPNSNGIAATASGRWLVVVSTQGESIFRVDPQSGESVKIEVEQAVTHGDGLVLSGSRLYVVQNLLNRIAVIDLAPNLRRGHITAYLTSPAFKAPTTAALLGDSLYVVNGRFGTPVTPDTEYDLVRVPVTRRNDGSKVNAAVTPGSAPSR